MAHNHDHHSHAHSPDFFRHTNRLFVIGIVLNFVFVLIEFFAGLWANSLALMSDAGHNLSDVASLGLALAAFKLLAVKATEKFTYGYRKASILISLLNAVILLVAVGGIGYESIYRLLHPQPVESQTIIWVASIGIVINTLSAVLFLRDKERDLNIKGAYLHLVVDALVSVGVVASGIIIVFTGWYWIDPLISFAIILVIVISMWSLLRDSLTLSLDAVPRNIDIADVRAAALTLPGIKDIHHIHVWAISTSENAITAHLVLAEPISFDQISSLKDTFRRKLQHLGIQHATIETELSTNREEGCETTAT
jgi:cobalt-zinc-cadmium efflux system protein